jgi:hypothetical protein
VKNKKKQQESHAKRRFRERFGVNLTHDQHDLLLKQISTNRAKFIERQSNRITVWEVTLSTGEKAQVVHDSKRHLIVTALYVDQPSWGISAGLHRKIEPPPAPSCKSCGTLFVPTYDHHACRRILMCPNHQCSMWGKSSGIAV